LAISRNNSDLRSLNLKGLYALDFDITNYERYDSLNKYLKNFENIDVLINNAGLLVNKPFEDTSLEDFQKVYSTNVFSVAMLTKFLIKRMNNRSNVVNISSIGGVEGTLKFPGLAAYSSSKGALNILTEMLAEEYKEQGIHFNSLALGSVQTKMLNKAFPGFKASTSAQDMAKYIYDFSTEGYKLINGKVISISSTTP
jgi:NAD(P)-dependent dehydrogenase (short-subunit alcohol dehydrogenase family)